MSRPVKLLAFSLLAAALPAIVAGQTKRQDVGNDEREARKHAILDAKRISPAEQRILAALDEETETGFIDTALKDAVDFLEQQHGVTIIIDEGGLVEEGIASDEPINLDIRGITLRSALNIMLDPLGLTYVIEDEVMKITTSIKADYQLETRVYDVSRLAKGGIDSKALAEVVERIIIETTEDVGVQLPASQGGTGTFGPIDDTPAEGQVSATQDATSTGSATTTGAVMPLPGCLVVKHSQQGHREVTDLLQQLHRLVDVPDGKKVEKVKRQKQ